MNGGGHRITIDRNAYERPRVTFNPNPLYAQTGDEIFWTNNDSEAHWPGLLNSDGTINGSFFMSTRIRNGDVSPIFLAAVQATFNYACSIHPDEKGAIIVT